ncbi:MAG: right-handed parallel beta-helix repeat-containing protein, partial [Myxococcota bacterium]|nr:right-handed parallel beta-helix repeat-containing protein [Myxococcota bacterium]
MQRLVPLLTASLLTGCGTDQPTTTACAEGEVSDGNHCVPEACGTGTWGNLETSSGTIHVDGSSPSGGDGSESEPLTSIQDGLDAAGKSGHVVVAAGTYLETLELGSDHIGTTLEGRCRDLVIVDGSEGKSGPLSEPETLKASHTGVSPGSWTVSGLSIVNGQYGGVTVHSGELNLVDSTVADSAWANIAALGGTTNLLRVNVRDARVHESYGGASGVVVDGAVLDATDCTISDHPGFGMYYSNASGRLEGCRIEGNRPNPDDHENYEGRGIHVRNGSTVEMIDCTVTDNRETGVMVLDSTVVLDGTTVERTGLATNGYGGRGVNLQEGATGEISNCRIRDNMDVALYVSSSSATVTGTEISGTLPDEALQGIGIVGRSS